jgi:hypothetical protein
MYHGTIGLPSMLFLGKLPAAAEPQIYPSARWTKADRLHMLSSNQSY